MYLFWRVVVVLEEVGGANSDRKCIKDMVKLYLTITGGLRELTP